MSSQQQQHVINMTGLDSGPVTTGISGGGGGGTLVQGQQQANLSNSTGHGSNIPPGAYRPGSSQRSPRLHQSVYAPLSPSQNQPHNYTSPRMTTLSPMSGSAASTSQLGRSQSLGHAAYQQMQASSQQGYGQPSSSSLYPQQPIEASPYRSREKGQPSYSEGNTGGALLPTINTHIPQSSLMGSPYSPNMRNSMALDTPNYNAASGPPKSPVTRQQGGGSPYAPNLSHNNRPMSMYDTSYGLHQPPQASSRNSYHPMDNQMNSSHRASPGGTQFHGMGSNQHLRGSDNSSGGTGTIPSHTNPTSPHGDSLPLYSNATAPMGHMPSSPYGPSSSGQYVGAPPRLSVVGGGGGYGMNMESTELGGSTNHRERRGTVTSADVGGAGAGDFAKWDRQQRMAAAEAAEAHHNQPHPPKLQEAFRRVRDVSDLKAVNEPAIAGTGRRADPSGGYVSVSFKCG